jgi:parallel beta-helix repeat protein
MEHTVSTEGGLEIHADGGVGLRASARPHTFVMLLGILVLVLLAILFAAKPVAAATCTGSLQAKIDAAPPGGTVTAEGCIYRERIEIDKPISIVGEPGAEIRGSDDWSGWKKRKGRLWISTRTLPAFPETMDQIVCMPGTDLCHWPEQVFVNGNALTQVGSAPAVGQGEFFVNRNRKVILKDDPRENLVEVTVRREWIVGTTSSANDVTIDNVDMRHAANSGRTAALLNRPCQTCYLDAGANWTVENSTLSDAHGGIVSLKGGDRGHTILDNQILRGGQIGIHGTGDGSVIRGNEIAFNNTERFCYEVKCGTLSGIGETGGAKFSSNVDDTVFDSNVIHDNYGHGVHYDGDCTNNTISNNRIYDNARKGIHYELCYSGKIFGNVVYHNGWATTTGFMGSGIVLQNSSSTEVYDNTVAWNAEGIVVLATDREGTAYDLVHDVHVHDNTIFASNGPTEESNSLGLAWVQGWTTTLFDPANNNWGANNKYWYTSPESSLERFRWHNKSIGKLADFNATLGEENGIYLTPDEKDAVMTTKGIPPNPSSG